MPAKDGRTRNLTNTSGVHERNSKWSPDGKLIAYVSDASGEDEIWVLAPDGKSAPRQLTTGGDTYKYEIAWSPDSKKILWADKKLRLQYVEVETQTVKPIAQAKVWEIRDAVWSPDSRWVAYSQEEREGMNRLYLFSLEQGKTFTVTRRLVRVYSPRVQRRRQISVLCLQARFRSDLQRDGVEPRLSRHGPDLSRHAGEDHAVAVPAAQR